MVAYWNDSCGLMVSLHGASQSFRFLQVDPHCNPSSFDDAHVWRAFFPCMVSNCGVLFGHLNYMEQQLYDLVEKRGRAFHLPDRVVQSWALLEDLLLDVIKFLWIKFPDADKVPMIEMALSPSQCGYKNLHNQRTRSSLSTWPLIFSTVERIIPYPFSSSQTSKIRTFVIFVLG